MKTLLLMAALGLAAGSTAAQNYISAAPAGGFDVNSGKDYVVLYAPADVISAMGSKIATDNNLDPDQVDNTLEYWVTDWDKKDLTLYNVPAEEGEVNSFGTPDFINATPLWAWGTGVFMPRAKAYDLSKISDKHHLHIGLRDFGSEPSKYQFAVGAQSTIKNNGFQVMVGAGVGESAGDFAGVGSLPAGNDGKWYYLDIPVADLVDPNGEFGFVYNFSAPIANEGAFTFTFNEPVCSTAAKSGPAPGESVYTYNITKLGSALSLDHVFFYVPDQAGIDDISLESATAGQGVYFDLTGRRVDNPAAGLYIYRDAKSARKVFVK